VPTLRRSAVTGARLASALLCQSSFLRFHFVIDDRGQDKHKASLDIDLVQMTEFGNALTKATTKGAKLKKKMFSIPIEVMSTFRQKSFHLG
jgi:hypothetical protein